MSERARMAASSAAWIASSAMAEFLHDLEEVEGLTGNRKVEIIQMALRAFDGLEQKILASLSLEEQLRSMASDRRAG